MSQSTDKRALSELREDTLFQEIDRFVPALQIVRALGVERNEVVHSRLIANLLDPDQHQGAEIMLRSLLRSLLDRGYLTDKPAKLMEEVVGEPWTSVSVETEFQFIDVVVRITTLRRRMAVGIENKIEAGEGYEQLGRYQAVLEDAFPLQMPVLLFLTPTGREPTTALSGSSVPAISVGYDLILEAVEEVLRSAGLRSSDRQALEMIAEHIREDILGAETEVVALVRELWRNHGKALRLAMEHRPRLEDVQDRYQALVRERFGDDARYDYWRVKGELREIKMYLSSWWEARYPFEFMLYTTDGLPAVRLLVKQNEYGSRAESLRRWARGVNANDPALIDEEFKRLPHWTYWRRVLNEPGYPPEAVLKEGTFDEATTREAVEAVVALYQKLQPHIETA